MTSSLDREALGQKVREVWIQWAHEQSNPKASWLMPWEGLSEPDREVDRRIGEELAAIGAAASAQQRVFVLTGWAPIADHVSHSPRIFATFDSAREWVAAVGQPGAGRGGWWQKQPGRSLKWRNPQHHERGFWEIVNLEVTP